MGIIDQFLQGFVAGGLEPGETVMGMGMLRHPTVFNVLGVPQRYDDHLAVATDRRLIVFDTEGEFSLGMSPKPKPVARNPVVWRYDELAAVRTGGVEGLIVHSGGAATWIALVPHAYCGPFAHLQDLDDFTQGKSRRYDIYAQIDGIDGQRGLQMQFPSWLEGRVNGGAFPMHPQRRAEVEAKIAERRAAVFAQRARMLQAAAERDAKLKAMWLQFKPFAVHAAIATSAVGALIIGGIALEGGFNDFTSGTRALDRYEQEERMLRRDVKSWVDDPKLLPPEDCPEKTWELDRRDEIDFRDLPRCHACWVTDAEPKEKQADHRVFSRGGKVWDCPPPAAYKARLRLVEGYVESGDEDWTEGLTALVIGGIALLFGLVGLPVAILLGLKKRKALAAGAGAAASGAAAAPQQGLGFPPTP